MNEIQPLSASLFQAQVRRGRHR